MPIRVDSEIRVFNDDEFHSLAAKVIGIAFDVHNEFGRLMDEAVYKQAIRNRCEAGGIVTPSSTSSVEKRQPCKRFPSTIMASKLARMKFVCSLLTRHLL